VLVVVVIAFAMEDKEFQVRFCSKDSKLERTQQITTVRIAYTKGSNRSHKPRLGICVFHGHFAIVSTTNTSFEYQ
jgi:hypothetical protein